jgi:tetrathionate reductase subunit C
MSAVIDMHGTGTDLALLPWAAQFFFLIAISIAAFLLSLPGLVGRMPAWHASSHRALLVALAFGYVAPITLLTAQYLHAASWIEWEAYLIPFYQLGLGLFAWLCLRPTLGRLADRASPHERTRRIYRALAYGGHDSRGPAAVAAVLCGMGALAVLAYTAMEIMHLTGGQGLSYAEYALRSSLHGMTRQGMLGMVATAGLCFTFYRVLSNAIPPDEP